MRRADRRRSGVTRLLVTLVGLTLLAWGFDWAARLGGESLVAHAVRADTRLGAEVDVQVDGWFFLPQVVDGNYNHLVVTLTDATAQGLHIKRLRTDLYDVKAALSDVIRQRVTTITVQRTHEQALLTYGAINAYLAARNSSFTLSEGVGGEVEVTTHMSMFGKQVPVSADARVTAGSDYVDVQPTRITTGSSVIDAVGDFVLKARLRVRIPMTPLPFGQQVQSVQAGQQGLTVIATGRHVVLTRQGIQVPAIR